MEKLTIASEYPEINMKSLGDSDTPAGWTIMNAVGLTKINNIQFVYEGFIWRTFKFPLNYVRIDIPYLMPKTHDTELKVIIL